MASYAPLPAYQAGNALNFQPLSQGIDDLAKGVYQGRQNVINQNVTNALARGDYSGAMGQTQDPAMALHIGQAQRQQNQDLRQQGKDEREARAADADWFGNQAMAVANMPMGPQRVAAWQNVVSKHPNVSSLDPMHLDPASGPGVVSAEYGKFKNKLDEDYKRAQIEQLQAHSAYYRQAGAAKNALAQPGPEEQPRQMGMREDGTLYDIAPRTTTRVLGESAQAPDREELSQIPGSMYGDSSKLPIAPSPLSQNSAFPDTTQIDMTEAKPWAAVTAHDVRGLVVTPKGVPSQYGTQRNDQNLALDKVSQADRDRFQQHMDMQRRWTAVNGKAPSGMKWDEDGTLIDLKDQSKKKIAADRADPMIQDIQTARDVLIGKDPENPNTSTLERNIAMTPWLRRWTPETTGAIENLKHTVATMTALVETNRHANAQDVRFLKFFSVEPDDTADAVGRKLDQLNRIYNTYVGNKEQAQPGAMFKSKTQQAGEREKASSYGHMSDDDLKAKLGIK